MCIARSSGLVQGSARRLNKKGVLQVGVAARAADADNEGGELAQLMEALGNDEHAAGGTKFCRDDRVIVMEGELKTLVGRVVEVKDDGLVRIMPLLEGLEELDLPARQLQKYFQARTHPLNSACSDAIQAASVS